MLAFLTAPGGAQGPGLTAADQRDPLALARAVDRVGEDAVLASLAGESVAEQLAATRGAPFLPAPDLSLPRLVELAAGRDPHVAPAAAQRVVAIARGLRVDDLSAEGRESLPAVREALAGLAADGTAREDVRRAAAIAGLELASLYPPSE